MDFVVTAPCLIFLWTDKFLCSLPTGCLAECPQRSGISALAADPSLRLSRPAHLLALMPSAIIVPAAPLMLVVATASPWVATQMAWTPHPCSMVRGLGVGPAVSAMTTVPAPSWRTRPPSASTCSMPSPRGCAWCAGTLRLATTMAWPPARHAKPSSKEQFKVQCGGRGSSHIHSMGGWVPVVEEALVLLWHFKGEKENQQKYT